MNINHLRYFQEVCRQGSITKASEKCHVSQPSVTAAVNGLEKELGYRIFNRINNRLYLTDEGRKLLELTDEFLLRFDDFYKKAADISQTGKAVIRLGVPSVLGIFLFKKIIPDFEKRFPQIQLKIYETATVDGIEMLENSALDLLVGIKNKTSYADCDSREIFKSELMLAVSKRNPLAKENLVTGEMLEDIPMVLISKGSYHYQEIVGTFGREKLNITMHSSQISTIKHVISASNAATIIYREVFEDDPDICCIPLEVSLPAYVHIFWKKNTYKSEAMDKVISYLSMPDI